MFVPDYSEVEAFIACWRLVTFALVVAMLALCVFITRLPPSFLILILDWRAFPGRLPMPNIV